MNLTDRAESRFVSQRSSSSFPTSPDPVDLLISHTLEWLLEDCEPLLSGLRADLPLRSPFLPLSRAKVTSKVPPVPVSAPMGTVGWPTLCLPFA